ncbi:MAG: ABC transporter ATP-binding protein [Planctomycetota bacterium]
MADPAIRTENLSKSYRTAFGFRKVEALRGLNLTVERGEVFGLLGPNGSGKTTTMKLLLGLIFPTGGKAEVLGEPASSVSKNYRIGFLPEESYLYRFLNAEETLDFYGRLFDLPRAERRRRAGELIEMTGIGHARKRPVREYSKGMARRLGLAQALINDPDLLLLDEPTTGLDPIGNREMKQMILELRRRGKTILLCSHLLADVEDVCDRLAILASGRLARMGAVSDLLTRRDVLAVEVERKDAVTEARLREVLAAAGLVVRDVRHPSETLEEVFLRTVAAPPAPPPETDNPAPRS